MNRRLYNNQSFVETAIYRVFVMIYSAFELWRIVFSLVILQATNFNQH